MDVLVLGGSIFLGRAVVAEALALGASVTVFNRGRSGPTPDGATQLTGDRTRDLALLDGRYDLVVDTSGYVPAQVAASAAAVRAEHYVFVSTINVFPGWPAAADYHAEGVHPGDPDAAEAPAGLDESQRYGWLKAGCEAAVRRRFGDRCTVLRAGCIVGPDDRAVGRLPVWIARVARGGAVLVPGAPDDPMALIDARDLARFALAHPSGTFEAGGPRGRDTRADLMAACRAATGADASFTYVPDEWLAGQDVAAWTELPLWLPRAEGPSTFVHDNRAAEAAGLTWRPLAETVADTWAWQQSAGWAPSPRTPGLAPEREAELLDRFGTR